MIKNTLAILLFSFALSWAQDGKEEKLTPQQKYIVLQIENLESDNPDTRDRAAMSLIVNFHDAQTRLEAKLKTTNDPDLKARIQEIIKKGKEKQDTSGVRGILNKAKKKAKDFIDKQKKKKRIPTKKDLKWLYEQFKEGLGIEKDPPKPVKPEKKPAKK